MRAKHADKATPNAKIAYAVLCAESYALAQKPEADWKPLFEKLWEAPASAPMNRWGEWADDFIEMVPEFLYAGDAYEDGDFYWLSRDLYDVLVPLEADMPTKWNDLLAAIQLAALQYIDGEDDPTGLAEEAYEDIENALLAAHVELPKVDLAIIDRKNAKSFSRIL